MRAIALVDLDDTLFQSLRKCPPDVPAAALSALGFARDGAPLGYATPRQMNFLAWLAEMALVVPVTARSREALDRVRIPYDAAICAHGGLILASDGTPDAAWSAHIAREAAPYRSVLAELVEAARAAAGERRIALRARVLSEAGTGLYVLLKHEDGDEVALGQVLDAIVPLVPKGWTVHRNGNNAALMPPFLGKAHAAKALLARLRAQHPAAAVIGVGDSVTDAPFMLLCDYAMMPSGSQLGAATLARLA